MVTYSARNLLPKEKSQPIDYSSFVAHKQKKTNESGILTTREIGVLSTKKYVKS